MRKFISIFMALALFVTVFSGCASSPQSSSEYKKLTASLIDKYLTAAYGALENANEKMGGEYDEDAIGDAKKSLEKELKTADDYLNQIEKLNPPSSMRDFHEDLLSLVERVRAVEESTLEAFSAEDEDEFQKGMKKANSSMEKLMNKAQKFIGEEDNDWLMEKLQDGEFMELINSSSGVVSQSRVTSANQTAKYIKYQIATFIDTADTYGYGMKYKSSNVDILEILVDSAGNWSVTGINSDHFKANGDTPWSDAGGITASSDRADANNNPAALMLLDLASAFPSITRTSIYAVLVGGQNCTFVAYTADTDITGELAAEVSGMVGSDGTPTSTAAWNGKTAGISAHNGYVVGTSPIVGLG